MSFIKPVSLMILTALASGCVNLQLPQSTVQDKYAERNFNAQVVDPAPVEGAPQKDAAMVDAAVDRYRNDEVKSASEEAQQQVINLGFGAEGGGN